MIVDGKEIKPIWLDEASKTVKVIDQRELPHRLVILDLNTVEKVVTAIKEMVVRGAPLLGVTAAYGIYVALTSQSRDTGGEDYLRSSCRAIRAARPTAVNLSYAVDKVLAEVSGVSNLDEQIVTAQRIAGELASIETENCKMIGQHGVGLIESISRKNNGQPVNILTHCNAGWLACIEYGTATAPIYAAYEKGIDLHVWVDETRPLNQGARLTAWELGKYGIQHTVITDNTGGHLMQHGLVDMVIVGTDRTTRNGDVANKIGTYLKALAARDNHIPFYVALPSSTFDWTLGDGLAQIPIETRDPDEIRYVQGLFENRIVRVLVSPANSHVANYAFDVTPARLVTGLITERGICKAEKTDIRRLFPEKGAR
jgi:methylthioribose-1-phosphate isomerase